MVGDDRGDRGFGAGTGRGRNGDDVRNSGVREGEADREIPHQTAHLFDGLVRFGNAERNTFAGVHRRAAAEADETVTAFALVHRECRFDVPRVTGLFHALQHGVEDAELMQGLIGDDERFRAPVAFQDLGYPRGRAGALHDVLRRDQERERDIHQAAINNRIGNFRRLPDIVIYTCQTFGIISCTRTGIKRKRHFCKNRFVRMY